MWYFLMDKDTMDALIRTAIDSIWPAVSSSRPLLTPDHSAPSSFTVVASNADTTTISTEQGTRLILERAAFHATLRYLAEHGHGLENPCEIRSNNVYDDAGPLCRAARDANNRTRVINYIIPMLADVGLVRVNGARPNTVWLA